MAPDGGDLGRYSLSMWWSTGGGGDCRRKSWYSISVRYRSLLWCGAAPVRTDNFWNSYNLFYGQTMRKFMSLPVRSGLHTHSSVLSGWHGNRTITGNCNNNIHQLLVTVGRRRSRSLRPSHNHHNNYWYAATKPLAAPFPFPPPHIHHWRTIIWSGECIS